MSDELKLLPCPFCGGAGRMDETGPEEYPMTADFWISCSTPSCPVASDIFATAEEAAAAWNTRVPSQDAAAERAATVKLIRLRAKMAYALVRFGGSPSGGAVLDGLADEVEAGAQHKEPS